MNFNNVQLGGNLTRDPEIRVTPKGTQVLSCSLGVNRKWKDDSGQTREEATFVEFEAWGKTAEIIAKYHKKGSQIFIYGRLKFQTWEDKTSGQKRNKLTVVAEGFEFIGGSPKPAGTIGPEAVGAAARGPGTPKEPVDEDVPF
jgi:single-strand DNA-binding protein